MSLQVFNTDPFNWYVIEEAGRLTLVDAGLHGHGNPWQGTVKDIV